MWEVQLVASQINAAPKSTQAQTAIDASFYLFEDAAGLQQSCIFIQHMNINRFWALCLRHKGAPVPRWQQSQAAWYEGLLRVLEEKDPILGRHVLVARLMSPARDAEVLPPLVDAKLLQFSEERIVLAGMERDDLTRTDTAQAWLLVRGRDMPSGAGADKSV